MADAPPESGVLLAGHAALAFFEGGDRKGIRECKWGSGRGLEEDLMRDAAVLVFVAPPLANALIVALCQFLGNFFGTLRNRHTDFATGDLARTVG